jgi:hypothetical protein
MMKDVSVKRQMKRTGIAKDAVLDLACDIDSMDAALFLLLW